MGSGDVQRVRKYHTKALHMNKFVYFIDTEFFYIHSTNTSNLSDFHKTYYVSFDNNRTVQSTTRIYFVLSHSCHISRQNQFSNLKNYPKC